MYHTGAWVSTLLPASGLTRARNFSKRYTQARTLLDEATAPEREAPGNDVAASRFGENPF